MADDSVDGELGLDSLEQVINVERAFASKQAYNGSTYSGNNHDSGGVFTINDREGRVKYAVTFVADGLSHGGYGEIASNIAKQVFEHVVQESLVDDSRNAMDLSTAQLEEIALQAIDFANEVIFNVRGHIVSKKFLYDEKADYLDVALTNRETCFREDKQFAKCVVEAVARVFSYTPSETIILGRDKGEKPAAKDKVLATTFTANIIKLDHKHGTYNHTIVNVGDSRSFLGREDQQEQQVTEDMVLGTYVPDPGDARDQVCSALGLKPQLRDGPVDTFSAGEYGLTVEKLVRRYSIQTFEENVLEQGQNLIVYSATDGAYKFADKDANGNLLVRASNCKNLQNLVNFAVESTHTNLQDMPISGIRAITFSGEGSPDDATVAAIRLTLEETVASGASGHFEEGDVVGYRIVVRNIMSGETVYDQRYHISDFVVEDLFIRKAGISIGRHKKNRIVINDQGAVSRKHGRLYLGVGNQVMYEDLNSQNGSFFHGQTSYDKITGSVVVPEGAVVSLAVQYDVELVPLIKKGDTEIERPYDRDTTAPPEDAAVGDSPLGPTRDLRAGGREPVEIETEPEVPPVPPPLPEAARNGDNGRRPVVDLRTPEQRGDFDNVQVPELVADATAVEVTRADIRLADLLNAATAPVSPPSPDARTEDTTIFAVPSADPNAAIPAAEAACYTPVELGFMRDGANPSQLPVTKVEKESLYRRALEWADRHLGTVVAGGLVVVGVIVYALTQFAPSPYSQKTAAPAAPPSLTASYNRRDSEPELPREPSPLETTASLYATPQPREVRVADIEIAQPRRTPDPNPYAAETVSGFVLTPVHGGDRLFYLVVPEKTDLTVKQMVTAYNTGKGDVCTRVTPADVRVLGNDGRAYHLSEGTTDTFYVEKDQRFIAECKVK